jgi:ArsR family transcriptional regulator, arsenate/arsenite/antimonite-responsive transcriptional repressor
MKAPVAFANAIADETRFRVIQLLLDQTLCVCELADVLKVPQSTLSSQLTVIQRAAMLETEKRGKWMFYRVKPEFHTVLKTLFSHFDATPEANASLARDQKKAARRILCRDQTCCPTPAVNSTRRDSKPLSTQ